jgi:hypothetical protein
MLEHESYTYIFKWNLDPKRLELVYKKYIEKILELEIMERKEELERSRESKEMD